MALMPRLSLQAIGRTTALILYAAASSRFLKTADAAAAFFFTQGFDLFRKSLHVLVDALRHIAAATADILDDAVAVTFAASGEAGLVLLK